MFIPLQSILPFILKKKGIQDKIETLTAKEKAERIARIFAGDKIKAVAVRNQTLFLKTADNYMISEMRLKETIFLQRCRDEGIPVHKIKYTL